MEFFSLHNPKDYHDLGKFRKIKTPLQYLFIGHDSVYSAVLYEFFIFVGADIVLRLFLSHLLFDSWEQHVVDGLMFLRDQLKFYPSGLLIFALGSYMSLVTSQWRGYFSCVPWGDDISLLVERSFINTDESKKLAKEIIRNVNQMTAVVFSYLKYDFIAQDVDDYNGQKLFTSDELQFLQTVTKQTGYCAHYFLAIKANKNLKVAENKKFIKSADALSSLIEKHSEICRKLLEFQWIHIPLAITQVVTLLVYSNVVYSLLNIQSIPGMEGYDDRNAATSVTSFCVETIKFFIFVGWHKIAVNMFFPFKSKQESFDFEGIMKRNITVLNMIIDTDFMPRIENGNQSNNKAYYKAVNAGFNYAP